MRLRRPTLGLRWYFEHNDGRLIDKWDHYFDVYERHFRSMRGAPITMLEIGVSHGGSLQMFKHYFGRRSTIVGIDIEPRVQELAEPGIVIEIGDQADPAFLAGVCERHGPFDIVLDDGSHRFPDQRASLHAIWPSVKDGGVYMVEDVHTSYMTPYGGGLGETGTFVSETHDRIDDLHRFWLERQGTGTPNEWTTSMAAVHVYDSIVVFEKQRRAAPRRRMTGRPVFATLYGYDIDDMMSDEHRAQLASLGRPLARVRRTLRDPRGAWRRLRSRRHR